MNSKFLFGEVYCQIYCGKFNFPATLKQSHRAYFDLLSDDIPPQMNILNIVITILMHSSLVYR